MHTQKGQRGTKLYRLLWRYRHRHCDWIVTQFPHIDPVKALYWSAILNGLVAAPLMAVIMMMVSNPKVMGKFVISAYLRWVGWCATTIMLCVGFGVVLNWKA